MIEALKEKREALATELAELMDEAQQRDAQAQQFQAEHNHRMNQIATRIAEIRGAEAMLAELISGNEKNGN